MNQRRTKSPRKLIEKWMYGLLIVIAVVWACRAADPYPRRIWNYIVGDISFGELTTGRNYAEYMRIRKAGPFDEALFKGDKTMPGYFKDFQPVAGPVVPERIELPPVSINSHFK